MPDTLSSDTPSWRADISTSFPVQRAADATLLGSVSLTSSPKWTILATRAALEGHPSDPAASAAFPTIEAAVAWIEANPNVPFLGDPDLGLDQLMPVTRRRVSIPSCFGRVLWSSQSLKDVSEQRQFTLDDGYVLFGFLRTPYPFSIPQDIATRLKRAEGFSNDSNLPESNPHFRVVAALFHADRGCCGVCFWIHAQGQGRFITKHIDGPLRAYPASKVRTAGFACQEMVADFSESLIRNRLPPPITNPGATASAHAQVAWRAQLHQLNVQTTEFFAAQPTLFAQAQALHAPRLSELTSEHTSS